jgi:hypothetical protein
MVNGMENEVWKAVVGYPELAHVEVSNRGRVRTLDRLAPSARERQPTQLRKGGPASPWIGNNGYFSVSFKVGPARKKYLVHRLVALAFVDGHFPNATVDHIDGNKLNNLPSNLRWVSLARNTSLQWETGLVNLRGERNPGCKLTDAQVRELRASDERVSEAAARLGVSTSLIYMIRAGKKRVAA